MSSPSASDPAKPIVRAFFDEATFTATFLVIDPETRDAAIIDPVLDYDPATGEIATRSADAVLAAAQAEDCRITWLLDTHVHADHLSALAYLKLKTGATTAIGARVTAVQQTFAPIFAASDLPTDGSCFDRLLDDGASIAIGAMAVRVMHTPGHTPACVSYHVGDAVFVGDTLFMPDYGTARTDFPGGDAHQFYASIQRLLALPPATRMFVGHDYKAPGREDFAWETTVAAQLAGNIHVRTGVTEGDFVSARRARDVLLAAPRLLLPSIQVNMRAGKFPPPAANGTRYLVIPVRAKGSAVEALM
jgi:glyoxylase-like metal-dependent hydrolase (beta-lactamase superfamily II)